MTEPGDFSKWAGASVVVHGPLAGRPSPPGIRFSQSLPRKAMLPRGTTAPFSSTAVLCCQLNTASPSRCWVGQGAQHWRTGEFSGKTQHPGPPGSCLLLGAPSSSGGRHVAQGKGLNTPSSWTASSALASSRSMQAAAPMPSGCSLAPSSQRQGLCPPLNPAEAYRTTAEQRWGEPGS